MFPGWVKLDQAVSMLPEAQHSAWLTSVFSTRLQVASRPCWSQQTPPADRGGRSYRARGAPQVLLPTLKPWPAKPAAGPWGCIQLVLSNCKGDDPPPTWEGGIENHTGVPALAADSSGILPLGSGPHTALLPAPPLPASSPHGSRPPAQAWHPAQPVKHPELDMSGSVGPRAASPASALCLDSARGARAPRLAAPSPGHASYSLQLGNIPLHELTVSPGTAAFGEGASAPLSAGLGWGCRVRVGGQVALSFCTVKWGQEWPGAPIPGAPRHCAELRGTAQFEARHLCSPYKGFRGPEWDV